MSKQDKLNTNRVQIAVRISGDKAQALKEFAVKNHTTMQKILESKIDEILEGKER